MSSGNGKGDKLDQAIAVGMAPQPVEMAQHNATISSTGRPAVLVLPMDATDAEILELVAWLSSFVAAWHRQRRAPKSRIIVPGPPNVPPPV